MAKSKCPKCDNTNFELAPANKIKNCNFKMYFIQCSSCGSVVGTADFQHAPTLINSLAKKLGFKL